MAIRMTGLVSGMDTESIVKQLMDAQRMKNKRTTDKQVLLTWKQDKWKELNTKLYKLYTEDLSKLRLQGNYQTKKVTSSNEDLVTVTGTSTAPEGAHSLKVLSLASSQYMTSDKLGTGTTGATKLAALGIDGDTTFEFTVGGKTKTLEMTYNPTINDFVSKAREAGLNANYDVNQGRFFISSKESGTANAFSITAHNPDAELDEELKFLRLNNPDNNIAAKNSNIEYNGVTLEGSSNVVAVNGLTITLKGESLDETVNLSISNDTQATYDMVKNFVKNYNEILKEMNALYGAPSSRGYDPLSDDDREGMTDAQIEKWEDKIKDSILRRDSTLGSVRDTMRNSLLTSVEVDGKKYSLASFGIVTSSDYAENGLLHINGDKDDALYSDMTDKLMKALEEDPDVVAKVLSGITTNLYSNMQKKMSAIPNYRSAFTFYNDKEMDRIQDQYKKQVKTLEDKLVEMENRYFKQFTAMETALAKMQQQSSALAGMLGTYNNQ